MLYLNISCLAAGKHQYRRHFQGCHDWTKVCNNRTLKRVNGKHFTLRKSDLTVRLCCGLSYVSTWYLNQFTTTSIVITQPFNEASRLDYSYFVRDQTAYAIHVHVHGCPLSATVLFRWPDAAFGTVCHPMSRQLQRSLFFEIASRHTSSQDHFLHNF